MSIAKIKESKNKINKYNKNYFNKKARFICILEGIREGIDWSLPGRSG
ncbi:hypothetical protein [Bacillus sp. EB01]|nr:hypothetical protein [Bacillus sp. EB01]